MVGNAGNDVLVGGTGSDTLTGGPGIDALYGNSGNGGDGVQDTFVFGPGWGTDFVFDFEHGTDKLDMTALRITFADLTITTDGPACAHSLRRQLHQRGQCRRSAHCQRLSCSEQLRGR